MGYATISHLPRTPAKTYSPRSPHNLLPNPDIFCHPIYLEGTQPPHRSTHQAPPTKTSSRSTLTDEDLSHSVMESPFYHSLEIPGVELGERLYSIAEELFHKRRYSDAVQNLQTLSHTEKLGNDELYLMGVCLNMAGQPDEAQQILGQVGGNYLNLANIQRALSLAKLGELEEAKAQIKKVDPNIVNHQIGKPEFPDLDQLVNIH